MTDILESLYQDHVHMARITAVAKSELASIEAGQNADLEMLEDIMCYGTSYPDIVHHPNEDIVFKQLKLRLPDAADEVDAILSEHLQVAATGIRFLEAIQAIREDTVMIRDAFVLIGRDYLSLLDRHMNTEESRLFPLAQDTLTVQDWRQLNERIEQRPDPMFGNSLDEDYRRLRQRIETHRADKYDVPV